MSCPVSVYFEGVGCHVLCLYRGKIITCPGAQDKLNFRQDRHIFSPNVRRASKKFSASLFFLDKDKLFGNRTSKNLDVLARGTSENLKIFLPLLYSVTGCGVMSCVCIL